MASLAVSINQFALEFSKKLAESAEGKNMFFSPWGISTSLAMVYLGTRGTTAAQMSQVSGKKTAILHCLNVKRFLKFHLVHILQYHSKHLESDVQ